MDGVLVIDSVTRFGLEAAGAVCVGGSHAGRYATYLCAKAGLRAVILNDAGRGREDAGIAGLADLDAIGMPGAAVSHLSCRIGDGADALARGRVSVANAAARACGVTEGMTARDAAALLLAKAPAPRGEPPSVRESRFAINDRAFAVDSASLVTPEDQGVILCTGSHGQLLGGKPETAIKHPVVAAFYNDAGIGIDEAGTSRLPALDARGIAGGVVSHMSARIGDGRSTHEDGVLSRINATAARMGLRAGMTAREAVGILSKLAPGPTA